MGGGRWGWAAALAIAAGAGGCDEGGAPTRGFHSRQLVSTRDPTLSLVSFGSKLVTAETDDGPRSFYGTDPDIAYYSTGDEPALTYWKVNLTDGEVTELGERIPSVGSLRPVPPNASTAASEGNGVDGVSTLFVIDAETGEDLATIDRVVGYSPVRATPIATWRSCGWTKTTSADCGPDRSTSSCARSWTSRLIEQLSGNWYCEPDPTKWRMTVLATAGPAPAGRGIYDIDLAQLTTAEVIAPALADVTWAPGATPSGSVRSDGLAPANVAIVYGSSGRSNSYLYSRLMNDGSEVMFAGPLMTPPASRELALFPIAGETTSVYLLNPDRRNVVTWQQMGASGSDTDLLVNWDTANQRIISCPFARGTLPAPFSPGSTRLTGIVSPDRSRYAFADAGAVTTRWTPFTTAHWSSYRSPAPDRARCSPPKTSGTWCSRMRPWPGSNRPRITAPRPCGWPARRAIRRARSAA